MDAIGHRVAKSTERKVGENYVKPTGGLHAFLKLLETTPFIPPLPAAAGASATVSLSEPSISDRSSSSSS